MLIAKTNNMMAATIFFMMMGLNKIYYLLHCCKYIQFAGIHLMACFYYKNPLGRYDNKQCSLFLAEKIKYRQLNFDELAKSYTYKNFLSCKI